MKFMDKVLITENHNFFAGVLNAVILEGLAALFLISLCVLFRLVLF